LGFRGGLSFGDNTVDFSPLTKSMRTGPVGGAYVEVGVSQLLFISTELHFITGGTSLSYQGASATFKIDEFTIPVSLKYKLNMETSGAKPYFFTGFSVGFV